MNDIVVKIETKPVLDELPLSSFQKPRQDEMLHFELGSTAIATDSQVKYAEAQPNIPGYGNFKIVCDEGTTYGGTDIAPSPLSYMTMGIACCLLSHLTMHRDAFEMKIKDIKVELRMKFSGTATTEQLIKDGLVGSSDGLDVVIIVDSDEPKEKIEEMFETSVNACLALQTVRNPVPVDAQLKIVG